MFNTSNGPMSELPAVEALEIAGGDGPCPPGGMGQSFAHRLGQLASHVGEFFNGIISGFIDGGPCWE